MWTARALNSREPALLYLTPITWDSRRCSLSLVLDSPSPQSGQYAHGRNHHRRHAGQRETRDHHSVRGILEGGVRVIEVADVDMAKGVCGNRIVRANPPGAV